VIYKSLGYYALVNKKKSPGVIKKIDNTIVAAQQIDLYAENYVYPNNLKGVLSFFKSLVSAESQVVMIRFSDLVFPFVFLVMLWLRLRGKKVIVDVPTPRIIGLKEMDSIITSPVKRAIRKLISYASASWVLIPANLIIQYAGEGKWFALGLSHKTLKMGNGILITDDIPLTKAVWPSNKLNLIAVAQLANWHGYDRMLYALAALKKKKLPCDISFTIVGDGKVLPFLKNLVNELELDNVRFTGYLSGFALNKVFENMHVGVASLGLHRMGLNEASELKTREYMARGLTVIASSDDLDFELGCPYRFQVENSDKIKDLVETISTLAFCLKNSASDVRSYAEKNLSSKNKLLKILGNLK
jgi:glycosyltransferase involved in cell wall biosynthesis